ncbi:MAG: 16S rRNA (uracil(1498)-N(3))-methyltransferase [Dysgonamonadaceae bacterium]|jgi:16S rRNA (uracil1498-N3)-methyltransferase|nr:16S rRNA (uracil(1498)-N(3))-methyltransferase [Dysgonamonadaceae bacterium]
MGLLFYAPDILINLELPQQESRHCVRVLRQQKGDNILITNGKGLLFKAAIVKPDPECCKIEILETINKPPHWKDKIEIAMSPTKDIARTEWFAEKATEIGIDKISFLKTRFSERKEIKTDRINRILISAMKQSFKTVLPEVQEMTGFERFVKQKFEGQKFIAHCYDCEKKLLSETIDKDGNILVLIGPEGDFSREEVALAIENGFTPVSLGESRLRSETAALTACQTIHILRRSL